MPTQPFIRSLIAASLVSVLLACSGTDDDPLTTTVTIEDGTVSGQASDRAASWEWLGIPYAEPPVGKLRWRAPRNKESWDETLDTTESAAACPQFNFFGSYIGDEDCLYLNVWRPQNQDRDLPVFFWIHGGGNNTGTISEPMYNGARMAELANVVVVTVQYRLGPLGWLYFPPIHEGDANDDSGNYGTLDIIAGLRWVQENISAFGGDPDNVTAAGESAGGADVLSLLLAEQARGLFHQAIVQSAGGNISSTQAATAAAAELLDNLMALEGVTPLPLAGAELANYMRGKSAEDIIRNNPGTPAILGDDHVLPAVGYQLFDSGEFPNKVPLLIGTNQDEYKLYTNPIGYNALPDASPELRDAVGRYASDLWRVNGADSIATQLRALPDYPNIYVYRFNWGSPDNMGNSPLPGNFGATGGAHHAAEIPFVFGNWDTFILAEFTDIFYVPANEASRQAMASIMVDYWGSFINQADPNGGNLPTWSPWSNAPGEFKAIVLNVNYDDNQPNINEDYTVWTTARVLADIDANVMEPLRTELMPYLQGRIKPD